MARQNRPTGSGRQAAAAVAGSESTADKIVWWSLHALVFLVPLAISNLTFLGFDYPITYDQFDIVKVFTIRTFAIVGLAAWGWSRLTKGGPLRRTRIDWLIVVFLAWVALTTVTSIHPPTALFGKYRRFEGLLSFVAYAVVFFLTVQAVDRPAKMRSLARTLVLGAVVVSAYSVCQYLGVDFIRWGRLPFEENRPFATYGNPDLLGGFLMFPLPISLALALSEKDTRWRWFYWIAFSLVGVTVLVSFVRGAWIGGVVSLLIVGVVAHRKRAKLGTPGLVTLVGAGLASVTVFVRSLSSSSAVLNVVSRVQSVFQFGQGSAKTRFEIWEAAWNAIRARPILGFGADTFRLVFPKYKPVEYVADAGYLSVADNVHNYPLQIGAALGIPGVLLLYTVFVRALWVSAKQALGRRSGERLLLAGFWSAVVGYLVHLLFGLSVTGSSFLLWVSIGILLVASAKTIQIPSGSGVWRTVVAALLVAAAFLGIFFNLQLIRADHYHLQSKILSYDAVARVQASRRAIELNPYNDMYQAELGLAYTDLFRQYLNRSEQLRTQGQDSAPAIQQARDAFDLAEQALRDVIAFAPPEYDNYVFLSNLQNIAATVFEEDATRLLTDAAETAERGVEVEPHGPAIRVQAARAYRGLGRYEEAIGHLTLASEYDPRYVEPRVLLADILLSQERYAEMVLPLAEALDLEQSSVSARASLRQLIDASEAEPLGSASASVIAYGLAAERLDGWTFEDALPYVEDAIREAPEDYWTMRYAALTLLSTGRTDEAVDVMERLVDLGTDRMYGQNVWATDQLAAVYLERGDYATAADWLERGLEIEPAASLAARQARLRELRERVGEAS